MEPQTHGFRFLRSKPFLHDLGVNAARRPKLRDFFKEVGLRHEEKRKAAREVVNIDAGLCDRLGNGNRVRHREGDLLNRGRSGFVNVVAAEVDRVVTRQIPRAVDDKVAHDSDGWPDRKNPFLLRDVFLKNVRLYGSGKLSPIASASVRDGKVHGKQNPRARIDGQGYGDLFKVDIGKKIFHVVDD